MSDKPTRESRESISEFRKKISDSEYKTLILSPELHYVKPLINSNLNSLAEQLLLGTDTITTITEDETTGIKTEVIEYRQANVELPKNGYYVLIKYTSLTDGLFSNTTYEFRNNTENLLQHLFSNDVSIILGQNYMMTNGGITNFNEDSFTVNLDQQQNIIVDPSTNSLIFDSSVVFVNLNTNALQEQDGVHLLNYSSVDNSLYFDSTYILERDDLFFCTPVEGSEKPKAEPIATKEITQSIKDGNSTKIEYIINYTKKGES